MDLKDLGWENYISHFDNPPAYAESNLARVGVENRSNYVLYSEQGELNGILRGNVLNAGTVLAEFPKVGDWVLIEEFTDDKAIISSVLPRFSKISRINLRSNEEQVIATNVDLAFIVQGLDNDFNLRRIERYITLVRSGNCKAVVILNKADLSSNPQEQAEQVKQVAPDVPVLVVSAKQNQGLEEIKSKLEPGQTVVFLGSSGVGKSTLVNLLLEKEVQQTQEVRVHDSRGRHTTTKRELFILENGSILIDTPGMRELGIPTTEEDVNKTFPDIYEISQNCKFRDCDHVANVGCAITNAVKNGQLEESRYRAFLKLRREMEYEHSKIDRVESAKRKQGHKKISKKADKADRKRR